MLADDGGSNKEFFSYNICVSLDAQEDRQTNKEKKRNLLCIQCVKRNSMSETIKKKKMK